MSIYKKTLTNIGNNYRKIKSNEIEYSKEFQKFIQEIIKEHYNVTLNNDSNMNYLWYMYYEGSKKNTYRPFIFMTELQLLKETGYIENEQILNLTEMFQSEDKDNFYIAYLSLKELRNQRLKSHGLFTKKNKKYNDLSKNYSLKLLNPTVFKNSIAT